MANPNFTATMSSNEIWYGTDSNVCLTDVVDGKAEADHTHAGYAAESHTHDGYAAADHAHTGYAAASHAHEGYADADHTHTGFASSAHTHSEYADADHTHSNYAAASHTHSGNVIVEQTSSPYVRLKLADATPEARVYKNASTTADYGLTLADYDSDGAKDSLIFCRNNALANKLYLNVQNDDDTRSLYYLYGEHHKPTAAEVGAVPTTGGTISGDTNVAGVLRVNGQQSFYFQTSTMSQTVGTNNATGGTTICCGSSADVNVNGAHMKTPTVVPHTNNTYLCGNANYRWAGIYSTAAVNVSSDERKKRDIDYFYEPDLLKFINALCVASYNYKDDPAGSKKRMGLIAQQVIAANPALAEYFVDVDEQGFYNLRPADFVFPLIGAVQTLSAQVKRLEDKLNEK